VRALVVYESMYGNTHAVATDVAAGLSAAHQVTLVPVTCASRVLVAGADLIVAAPRRTGTGCRRSAPGGWRRQRPASRTVG
jgi:menaquinone-dependent protoporphyrinogen IX oxidase